MFKNFLFFGMDEIYGEILAFVMDLLLARNPDLTRHVLDFYLKYRVFEVWVKYALKYFYQHFEWNIDGQNQMKLNMEDLASIC